MTVPTDKKGTAKTVPVRAPKKLIEVALPLNDINAACAYEKQPGIGAHPRGIHHWWARRPLAAARAVLFAQLVNDPGYERSMIGGGQRGMNAKDAEKERERLFGIIRRLVLWENTNNEQVLNEARAEIWKSWRETCELNKNHPDAAELFNPEKLPAFHDPFAGGGSIPLEAQRLGLKAYASDLNPVAVLINRAMIEIPPRFAGMPPVNPESRKDKRLFEREWRGPQGLAEDVRYYGNWIREKAESRIGHLYPKVEITKEMVRLRPELKPYAGQSLTVIAWIWARTVRSPNPAFSHVHVPLASTFVLSAKSGRETFIDPIVTGDSYRLRVVSGQHKFSATTKSGTKQSRANFWCLLSKSPIQPEYIKSEGMAGRIGQRLLAVVAEGQRGRVYLSPTVDMEDVAASCEPPWVPDGTLVDDARAFTPTLYGLSRWSDLFTRRQITSLTTFSTLIDEARSQICRDMMNLSDKYSAEAADYASAICVYLSCAVSRRADYNSSLSTWKPSGEQVMHTFGRNAVPMTWDFAESNILGDSAICWKNAVKYSADNLLATGVAATYPGTAVMSDAAAQSLSDGKVVSTDPPYYDNVPYADLSDFFYIWLRRSLKEMYPKDFATLLVPKAEELVATPYRHGGKQAAESFFLAGMTCAMNRVALQAHPAWPVTIYYAFKQSDRDTGDATSSTGWQTFLAAVIESGFAICGTWPMRTEMANRMRGMEANALASSVVLVCRFRDSDAPSISRREFIRELRDVLPDALREMTYGKEHSPVAAVDLSQAIIGPGMAVFSKYGAVLEADGTPMTVKTALQLINRHLAGDDVDFDAPTRFCLGWFETHKWEDAKFGEADVLARSKGTSVDTVAATGVAFAKQGIVRLLKSADYPTDWTPPAEGKPPVWEALHHLIRAQRTIGIGAAGRLLAQFPTLGEPIRQLAYRLYTLCERNNDAEEARAYNELITSWPSILEAAQKEGPMFEQGTFL